MYQSCTVTLGQQSIVLYLAMKERNITGIRQNLPVTLERGTVAHLTLARNVQEAPSAHEKSPVLEATVQIDHFALDFAITQALGEKLFVSVRQVAEMTYRGSKSW
jgi:hypothetical protein